MEWTFAFCENCLGIVRVNLHNLSKLAGSSFLNGGSYLLWHSSHTPVAYQSVRTSLRANDKLEVNADPHAPAFLFAWELYEQYARLHKVQDRFGDFQQTRSSEWV